MVETICDLNLPISNLEFKSISCQADAMSDEQLGEWVYTRLGQISGDKYLLGRSLRLLFKPFPVINQKIENPPPSSTR